MNGNTDRVTYQNLAVLCRRFQSWHEIYVQELGYSAEWFEAASALVNRIAQAIEEHDDDALEECFTQNRRLLLEIGEAGSRYDRLSPEPHLPHDVYALGSQIGFLYSALASEAEHRTFSALQKLALSEEECKAIVEAVRFFNKSEEAPLDEWQIMAFADALDAFSSAARDAFVEFKAALSDEHRCDLICRDAGKNLKALQALDADTIEKVYGMMDEYKGGAVVEPHTRALTRFSGLKYRADEIFPALRERGREE